MKIIQAIWDPNRCQVSITWERPSSVASNYVSGSFSIPNLGEARILCAHFDENFDLDKIESYPVYPVMRLGAVKK